MRHCLCVVLKIKIYSVGFEAGIIKDNFDNCRSATWPHFVFDDVKSVSQGCAIDEITEDYSPVTCVDEAIDRSQPVNERGK